ncbi:MAG: hypothetical protein PVJ98_05940 [Akkermansiaceae bacterium]|jgi:hypothetical protein
MRKPILFIGLALLAAIGGFYWYSNQPEQQINGAIDDFLEAIDHQKISMETDEEVRKTLDEVVAERVSIVGVPRVAEAPLNIDFLARKISEFHQLTTLCEIVEESRTLSIIGSKAQAERIVTVTVAGVGFRREDTWKLVFSLEESDRWRIRTIRAKPVN